MPNVSPKDLWKEITFEPGKVRQWGSSLSENFGEFMHHIKRVGIISMVEVIFLG